MKKLNIRFGLAAGFALAATFLLTSILTFPKAKTKEIELDGWLFSIINEKDYTVCFEGFSEEFDYDLPSIDIPDVVGTNNGKVYRVIQTGEGALEGFSALKKLTIGKYMQKIGPKSFRNCKNLKTVLIKSKVLEESGALAFSKINSKAVISVPLEKLNLYEKFIKSSGLNGKKQKIKAWKTDSAEMTSLPKQSYAFSIGKRPYDRFTETDIYSVSDTVSFSAGTMPHCTMYGSWESRRVYKPGLAYLQCGPCRWKFESDATLAIHQILSECGGGNYIFGTAHKAYDGYYFVPDTDPCRVTFRFSLPEGLSLKPGTLRVTAQKDYEIDSDNYHVQVSGQDIEVIIDDIKSKPFHYPFDAAAADREPYTYAEEMTEYEGCIIPTYVIFDTEMRSEAALNSKITGSISYSYKEMEHTEKLDDLVLH